AWNAIKDGISTAWNYIKDTGSTIIGWFRDLPGKIMDALGDLGSLLLGAGRSIVDGLLGGLREKIGDVRSYFQNLTSMIPAWKGPLNKDKHLLEPAGEAIMGGLIRSIDKQRNNLRRTLRDVTKDIAGTDATMTLNTDVEARRRSTSRSRAS